jgi:hypothetical protein
MSTVAKAPVTDQNGAAAKAAAPFCNSNSTTGRRGAMPIVMVTGLPLGSLAWQLVSSSVLYWRAYG